MQLVALHQVLCAVDVGVFPFWVVRRPFGGSTARQHLALGERELALLLVEQGIGNHLEAVAFEIGFVNHPEAHLVSEAQQSWVV